MRKLVTLSIFVVVVLFWFVFAIHNALAGAGDFDPLFGTAGKVVTTMGTNGAQIRKVLVQADGKIVVVGQAQTGTSSVKQFALARYQANGSLDTTFGSGGRVFTSIPGGDAFAYDAVIQPNGRIVVVGFVTTVARHSSVIARFNSNGSLDTTFSGDGLVVYNYNSDGSDEAVSVILQPDGKILAASKSLVQLAGPTFCFFISRFNSGGTLDTTFSGDGKAIGEFGLFTTGEVKIGLQPDGRIIAAGPGGDGTSFDFAVVRYTAEGAFDSSFGSFGRVYTNFSGDDRAAALAMLPDGRFVVGGYNLPQATDAGLMLVRYTANGTKDTTFGFAGFVVQDLTEFNDTIESIAIQPDGKTVVVGRTGTSGADNDLLGVRYKTNGLPDPTFGTNGVKKISFGVGDDFGYSVALQPNGRIIAAGYGEAQTASQNFAIARLLGRGTVGDYDNDGASDIAVFRPSDGTWYVNRSDSGYTEYPFGTSTDRPVVGDFDGDNESDIAVFRPSNGRWYVLRSSAGYLTVQFGLAGDIPVPGDFDGDDKADIAVFRPSNGNWYYLKSSTGFGSAIQQRFGLNGDRPVPGDFDRDGKADLAVYRPSDSVWYILGSSVGFYAQRFGLSTDVPVAADLDGDLAADIAVYRPSDGMWHILRSSDGNYQPIRFGLAGDIPQPGDFDLDGQSDIAVYRPSSGVWHILRSSDGAYRALSWGLANDRPVVTAIAD